MFRVQICIADEGALPGRMAAMREWLDHQRFEPATFRHNNGWQGVVLQVVFAVEAEALAFANAFGGQVKSAALIQ